MWLKGENKVTVGNVNEDDIIGSIGEIAQSPPIHNKTHFPLFINFCLILCGEALFLVLKRGALLVSLMFVSYTV